MEKEKYNYNFENYEVKEIKEKYSKKGTKWVLENTEEEIISSSNYNNVFNSTQWFKNLGGSERVYKNYTCAGYIPTKLTSISPDKQIKIIRRYSFSSKLEK